MKEIQMQFLSPGEWNKFNLTAVYQDKDGYTQIRSYAPEDIPVEQTEALVPVITALVELAAPWQASQVWARLGKEYPVIEENIENEIVEPVEPIEVIELTIEATHAETGGNQIFTSQKYPEFIIRDPKAIEFFKYFTN